MEKNIYPLIGIPSEGKFTLGFTRGSGALNPMTLLNRNTIDHDKSTKNYSISILVIPSST